MLLAIVIVGLVLSGLTAFPLQAEMQLLTRFLGISQSDSGLAGWLNRVNSGLQETDAKYPFIAYGTDWLAFAHLVLAVLFIGPYRDPVRNIWVVTFGLIACAGIIPLALICGSIRGIPLGWQAIDCSFRIGCFVPLWIVREYILTLEAEQKIRQTAAASVV